MLDHSGSGNGSRTAAVCVISRRGFFSCQLVFRRGRDAFDGGVDNHGGVLGVSNIFVDNPDAAALLEARICGPRTEFHFRAHRQPRDSGTDAAQLPNGPATRTPVALTSATPAGNTKK